MPKINLRVPLDQPTLTQKTELKLAKQVKKEPRKARFPWDLGFLFVQPMKYALIAGFNLFKTEKEIYSMQPTDSVSNCYAKRTISLS